MVDFCVKCFNTIDSCICLSDSENEIDNLEKEIENLKRDIETLLKHEREWMQFKEILEDEYRECRESKKELQYALSGMLQMNYMTAEDWDKFKTYCEKLIGK
jgi:prefoldin subunit 5